METYNQDKNNIPKPQTNSVGAFIWDLVKIVAISMAIIIPFRLLVAEPFVVSGSSMVPNFHNSDYLIVDRVSYRRQEPKRGDVIVMKYPKDTTEYFIKRIVGLPGETVMLQNGKVVIVNKDHPQGMVIDEPYLPTSTPTLGRPGPYTLGSGEYFVLGDNRTASSDSRVWGILPENDIVGRAWLRIFPVKDFGFIKTPEYK